MLCVPSEHIPGKKFFRNPPETICPSRFSTGSSEEESAMNGYSKTITVLGAGSWGTALGHHLARAGHRVTLWGRDPEILNAIKTIHTNPKYFPGIELHHGLVTVVEF